MKNFNQPCLALVCSMLMSAAAANVTFQGNISTIPYDPSTEIVKSSSSAPGVGAHSDFHFIPNVFVGMYNPGGGAFGSLPDGILRASATSWVGYNISSHITLNERLSIVGSVMPTISVDLSSYIAGDFYSTSYSAGVALIFTAKSVATGEFISQKRFVIQDRGCELFGSDPSRICLNAPSPGGYSLAGIFDVPVAIDGAVDLSISLSANSRNGSVANAFNSAYLRLIVPIGVSVNSESGLFLTNVTSPVPEQSTFLLFASSLVFLPYLIIRRRKSSLAHCIYEIGRKSD